MSTACGTERGRGAKAHACEIAPKAPQSHAPQPDAREDRGSAEVGTRVEAQDTVIASGTRLGGKHETRNQDRGGAIRYLSTSFHPFL